MDYTCIAQQRETTAFFRPMKIARIASERKFNHSFKRFARSEVVRIDTAYVLAAYGRAWVSDI
jgi:hypothetical protein